MTIRSFIALRVPGECRSKIAAFQSELRRFEEPVKWARTEGIHLTLKFLGDISESQVKLIAGELVKVVQDRKSFNVQISGLGAFPSLKQARVLWAGLRDDENLLVSLATSIERALKPLGFPVERREFSPHLTLGRVKAPLSTRFTESFSQYDFTAGSFCVDGVHLMQSHLQPSGSEYSILAEFPLK